MGVGVDSIVTAFAIEGRTGAREIAEDGLSERGKIRAAEDVGELVFEPGGGVGKKYRNAVDDRMLTLAQALRTDECAFDDVVALPAGDRAKLEHRKELALSPAERTNRTEALAVFNAHAGLAANNDRGAARGDDLGGGGRDGRNT